jgi:hypothetical protein
VLGFNDELIKKESGDDGPRKKSVADEERDSGKVGTELIKDSGVNDLMMKNETELIKDNFNLTLVASMIL